MLELFTKSDEYLSMIAKKVDDQPEYKALLRNFDDALSGLGINVKGLNPVEGTATTLAYTARDMAYKVGFEDGVRFILNCAAGGASNASVR